MVLKEDKNCYARIEQRELLIQLTEIPDIFENYFLTGGTALSVFYLHHRSSEDLDLFTLEKINVPEILLWIRAEWPLSHSIIKSDPNFLSLLINDIKVEMVHDPLSIPGEREVYHFNESSACKIDTIINIASNKLCTLVSRFEPKDFIDFYFLLTRIPELEFDEIFIQARKKEMLFDDPPTATYQLEEGLRFARDHEDTFPPLKKDLNIEAFFQFYDELVNKLYKMFKPEAG